ncbi:DUF2220 domain-containing protein [Pseudomonas sp. LS1212]|uniref:DUF2220 domain-containing protein n=1 Tax=Pseudomonas sp. LS1212 TaxID=2972478 RepID=UPI00215C80AA|nr:DUF2220 domain-containing protein [Pseudomonas sp. LS1212]UVJ41747.1 DUF2220 domain-containing protein [Pseudomonas sp. LS1212]
MFFTLDVAEALDEFGHLAAILGIPECPFPAAPVQLQVFLPHQGWKGTLFIEIQVSFERAIRSPRVGHYRLAIAHVSGFKGSAGRLRQEGTSSLFFSNLGSLGTQQTDRFSRWLYAQETGTSYFWGDLDWAGLSILSALRASFPGNTVWQPGYQPMHCNSVSESAGMSAPYACKEDF